MNGYEYLIQRNRLMMALEEDLARIKDLPDPEREAETKRLQTRFDIALSELYSRVIDEYPGERRKKARPMTDPS